MTRIVVIDSHTEGEPTRVVVSGGPTLSPGSVSDQLEELSTKFDGLRSGVVCEPRGSDAVVGALLCEPSDPAAQFGVIFFNNVGYLGMCGHGTIGLVATLQHLGRIEPGDVTIETPVGNVTARLHPDGSVTITNIHSYRYKKAVSVEVPEYGTVVGDIAYGGNWFFLANSPYVLSLINLKQLTDYSVAVRNALAAQGITGADGAEIDHVELFGEPGDAGANSRNFVLCPGLAYDRSPCGTGTSAKLSCLAADGKLLPGQRWIQESIIGSSFEGQYVQDGDGIIPQITGTAFITAESTLIFDDRDPFRNGILP